MYSFAGFIVDSNLAEGQGNEIDQALGGRTYKEWKRLYDLHLRIGAAISSRAIIKISWRVSKMFGYLLSYTAAQDSMRPHQININFVFVSIKDEERDTLPLIRTPRSSFRGSISREGAERVLVLSSFAGVPSGTTAQETYFNEGGLSRIGEFVRDHEGYFPREGPVL